MEVTIAILIWQAVIFISILSAGRRRGWVIAFWVIWTLVQVAALPLSVLQLCTILAALLLARALTSVVSAEQSMKTAQFARANILTPSKHAAGQGDSASKTSPSQSPVSEPESLLGTIAVWSGNLNRKINDLAETEEIRRQAKNFIKTENFASEKEKRVMMEAQAHDQALTREIQKKLAKDEVLAELYQGYLSGHFKSPTTVRDRQLNEESALKAAQSTLDVFETMVKKGPSFVRTYLELRRSLDPEIGGNDDEHHSLWVSENPIILGRHLDDWLAKVKKTRGSS